MVKVVAAFIGAALAVALIAVAAIITGFVVSLVWAPAMAAAFPGLVASGAIASSLTIWEGFLISFLSGLLIKGSSGSSKSNS